MSGHAAATGGRLPESLGGPLYHTEKYMAPKRETGLFPGLGKPKVWERLPRPLLTKVLQALVL